MKSLQPLLALGLALGSVACSLLISAESAPLHCSQEGQSGPPACDEGFSCQAGLCQLEISAPSGESGAPSSLPSGGGQGGSDETSAGAGSGGAAGAEVGGVGTAGSGRQ